MEQAEQGMGGMTMRGVIVYRQSCTNKEIIKKKMKCSATLDGVRRRSIY